MSRRVSAIDIGSNAIRMMIADISPTAPFIHVDRKFRAAVRLGHDVFTTGEITPESMEVARETFRRFAATNREMKVQVTRAVATSACRSEEHTSELQSH